MLFTVMLLPTALSSTPEAPEASAFFYPAAISVLQDMAENCILLVRADTTGGRLSSVGMLLDAVGKWPEQYKIRAQRVLSFLEKQKRFQVTARPYEVEHKCAIDECKHAIGIAASLVGERPVLFAGGGCASCSRSILNDAQIVQVQEYPVSEFDQKRRAKRSIVIDDGQWSSDEFEKWVLAPVLRHAEILKLYDRLITRTADDAAEQEMRENYKRTLEWIIAVFARESTAPAKIVEIHGGVSTGIDRKRLQALEKNLSSFNDEVAAKSGIRPSIFLREETDRLRMPHGRYLITDKLGLLVERGFDLLWDDRTMRLAKKDPGKDKRRIRDVMLSLCPNPGSIETAVARVRELAVVR